MQPEPHDVDVPDPSVFIEPLGGIGEAAGAAVVLALDAFESAPPSPEDVFIESAAEGAQSAAEATIPMISRFM